MPRRLARFTVQTSVLLGAACACAPIALASGFTECTLTNKLYLGSVAVSQPPYDGLPE
jgi:hypothetical protein